MVKILAIESSCDETSASVISDGDVLSNVVYSQMDHAPYGGVIPELASRLHLQKIIRVVQEALNTSKTAKNEINAVAFTAGPGLMGALMVGTSFAKGFALARKVPLIAVNHMQAHVLANFLLPEQPDFPFLCLTVSGGHTQIVLVRDYLDMEIIGKTIDDAAGEAYDKAAKIMGLGYPGGPLIDRYASQGDPLRFKFPKPDIKGYDFSFSGLKTSLLYFLKEHIEADPGFIENNMADICAGYQRRIVSWLLEKLEEAARDHKVKHLAIAGGVSANSELRRSFKALCEKNGWKAFIPPFQYCTDNAGMIAYAGYRLYLANQFSDQGITPYAREGN